jgi:hypothetical protein
VLHGIQGRQRRIPQGHSDLISLRKRTSPEAIQILSIAMHGSELFSEGHSDAPSVEVTVILFVYTIR